MERASNEPASDRESTTEMSIDSRGLSRARRLGIHPSVALRRHFVALARRIRQWSTSSEAADRGRPISIGVTGLKNGVGNSTVAYNIASAMTTVANDRVLYIEADSAKNPIAKRLGKSNDPGLSEVIQGDASVESCTYETPFEDLFVLGRGQATDQQFLELPYDCLGPMLQEDLDQYGYVIVDLPVATELTPCFSICPQLDGVILTVDSRHVDQRVIERFKSRMADCDLPIIGLVMNRS